MKLRRQIEAASTAFCRSSGISKDLTGVIDEISSN